VTRERIVLAIDAADPAEREALVSRARQRGFHRFVVREELGVAAGPGDEVIVRRSRHLEAGTIRIPIVAIASEEELREALHAVPEGGTVAIEWTADRVIPLENAVAARGGRFRIWSFARSPVEIPGALGALEHGADTVVVTANSPNDVDAIESVIEGPLPSRFDWALVPVSSSASAGIGDRVIVDTTSLLRPQEGLLVGSAAAFLFHVASEAVGSKFSRARPFRVNAGAAHSYVLLADGSTRYLAELSPGDAVLTTDPEGAARAVRVGRLKVERRPLVQVTVEDRGRPRTVFLQEAETVRLSGESGRIATTELRSGTSVWGVRMPPARHLGRAIEETIEER
jgi:3-dehydroquinate synthase II